MSRSVWKAVIIILCGLCSIFWSFSRKKVTMVSLQDHVQKPDTDFEPNLVNTVCFLVQWVVQLTTFGVNYLGHPFNQSLLENKGLSVALRYGTIGFIVAATNILPGTDWALSLVSSATMVTVQRFLGADERWCWPRTSKTKLMKSLWKCFLDQVCPANKGLCRLLYQ